MKIDDVEFSALVVGPRDTLVIALPSTTNPDDLKHFTNGVQERLGHARVLVVTGAEYLAVLRGTAGAVPEAAH